MTILTNNPTILITGSEGSLAHWIINKISGTNIIVGIDNCTRYGVITRPRNYVFEQGDLCDAAWLESIFEKYKPTYILHCAAQIYGVVGFHKYSGDILAGNSISTSVLLQTAVKHRVEKVAYLSSSMVYERSEVFPLTEDMINNLPMPHTGYGFSKLFGEKLLEEYRKQYGLKYVIWRPFNIVTPLEYSESEPGIAHVIADFIQRIKLDQVDELEIFGTGNQTRCFSWIDDIASTIVDYSWTSITDYQAYNLSSEIPTKILDLAKMIWQKSNRNKEFKYKLIDSYIDDVIQRVPDCSKARAALGFKHTKSIEELLDICLADYK